MQISFPPHYQVINMDAEYVDGRRVGDEFSNEKRWQNLNELFSNGVDDMNLIFGSTNSTVHGMSSSLSNIEKYWDIEDENHENYWGRYFTYLILHPRLCCIKYGTLTMRTLDDIKRMRQLIRNSLYCLGTDQQTNLETVEGERKDVH